MRVKPDLGIFVQHVRESIGCTQGRGVASNQNRERDDWPGDQQFLATFPLHRWFLLLF